MTNDNVTNLNRGQLKTQQIQGETVLGIIQAMGLAGVDFEPTTGSAFRIVTEHPITGLDTSRAYASVDEAALFIMGYLLNNWQTVVQTLQRAA